jgi:filamentous hemagglutinin
LAAKGAALNADLAAQQAAKDAQSKIDASNLPQSVKDLALQNLKDQNFTANTPGAGALRNSVSVKFCNGMPCVSGGS